MVNFSSAVRPNRHRRSRGRAKSPFIRWSNWEKRGRSLGEGCTKLYECIVARVIDAHVRTKFKLYLYAVVERIHILFTREIGISQVPIQNAQYHHTNSSAKAQFCLSSPRRTGAKFRPRVCSTNFVLVGYKV